MPPLTLDPVDVRPTGVEPPPPPPGYVPVGTAQATPPPPPGYKPVEWSPADSAAVPAPPAGYSPVGDEPSQFDKTLSSLTSPETGMFPFNYVPTQRKQAQEGLDTIREGVGNWQEGNKLAGGLRVGAGALQYGLSPVTAATTSIAGQPLENATGLPKEYTDTAIETAMPVIGFGKVPKVVKNIFAPETVAPEAERAAAMIRKGSGEAARASEITIADLEPYRPAINALPEPERLNLMGYIEGTHARPVVPELQQVADKLRAAFQERRAKLQALPATAQAQFIDDYFPHMWQDPAAARNFANNYAAGKQGSGASLKARTVPTIEEGIQQGLVPATTDPIEAGLRYTASMDKFIAAMQTLDEAKRVGMVKYITPKGMGASGHPSSSTNIPDGWVPLDGRGAINGAGQHAYAPEDFARVYNNYLSQGFHGIGEGEYGAAYDAVRMGSNAATQMLLSVSGYHAFTMAEAAMSSKMAQAVGALRHGEVGDFLKQVTQVPTAPVQTARAGKVGKEIYLGQRVGTPEQREVVDLITQAGGRMVGASHALDYQSSALGSYYRAFKRGALQIQMMESQARAAGGSMATVKEAASHLGRVMDTMNQPIFEHYIPMLKNGAAMENLAQWIKYNPGATQADKLAAARKIVDSVDNRFGEMIQDNIFWNKFAKQSAMVAMLSYSWSMGAWRELGGGVRDAARAGVGKGAWSAKTDYAVGMALNWAVMSSAYQYMKTGEYPQNMRDLLAPRTGGTDSRTGEPERIIPPGIMKDIYGYYEHPVAEAGNKLNPALRLGVQTLTGKDWRDDPVFSPREQGESVQHKAPQWLAEYLNLVAKNVTPIQLQNMLRGKEEGSNLNAGEKLLGVRTAPRQFVDPEGFEAMKQKMWEKSWFGRKGRGGKVGHDAAEESRYGGPQ